MRMSDILSSIIDLLGPQAEPQEPEIVVVHRADPAGQQSPLTHAGDDINRFKQIVDLYSDNEVEQEYANEPNEKYASIEAVTTHAGGGLNGPKHPHDIRVKDASAYPNQQEC